MYVPPPFDSPISHLMSLYVLPYLPSTIRREHILLLTKAQLSISSSSKKTSQSPVPRNATEALGIIVASNENAESVFRGGYAVWRHFCSNCGSSFAHEAEVYLREQNETIYIHVDTPENNIIKDIRMPVCSHVDLFTCIPRSWAWLILGRLTEQWTKFQMRRLSVTTSYYEEVSKNEEVETA